MIIVKADHLSSLTLGRQGENLARKVVFDLSDWSAEYGAGTAELIVQRPGENTPYPAAIEQDGAAVTWTLTAADTALASTMDAGNGHCELRWYVGDVLVKSKIWRTWVDKAMDATTAETPPEPEKSWVDQVLSAGIAAENAAANAKADADRAAKLAEEVSEKAAQAAQDATESAQSKEAAQTAQRLAEYAQRAAETAKQAAEAAQSAAAQSANDAATAKQGAEAALKSAQDAAAAAAKALSDIRTLYQEMQTWAQGVIQDVNDAGSVAVQSVQSAGDAQVQRVIDEGTTQTANAKAQADAAAQSAAGAAQSAQEAAESAAVYDNVVTDVNQLKQDVAAETRRAKEAEDNRIKKFYTSNLGSLSIADSDDGKIADMVLYGKSEQKQYAGKNLLNPSLQTETTKGVTCTNNGDGTYTLNGTASENVFLRVSYNVSSRDKKQKIVGCPSGGSNDTYSLRGRGSGDYIDTGNGVTINESAPLNDVVIVLKQGTVCNNLVFKPMLTLDLSATYDDFEPYVGGIPSPNPDYPQEIKSVENCAIQIDGANLFDEDSFVISNGSGKYVERMPDGKLHFVNSVGTGFLPIVYFDLPAGTYTISIVDKMVISGAPYFGIVHNGINHWISEPYTFTLTEKSKINVRCTISETTTAGEYYFRMMLNTGSTAYDYRPYVDPQTAAIPFTLHGIGDVRDELYVYADGTGKLVQRIGSISIGELTWYFNGSRFSSTNIGGITYRDQDYRHATILCSMFSSKTDGTDNTIYQNGYVAVVYNSDYTDAEAFKAAYADVLIWYTLDNPVETALTAEQVKDLFDLRTHYGGTNILFQSENGVEPAINFNYACALENFVEYIKAAQGDDRKFIYDMDERMTDAEYIAAMAYVNSEYASALTELEV